MNNSIITTRMVACLFVVLIHVSAGVVTIADESTVDWWLANILQAVIFWPVPVFIMISGYLLLEPKDETTSQFIKKRTTRILIPTLFWTCAYLIWGSIFRGYPSSISQALRCVLSGNVSDHLYFLFALFGLYLLTPPLRAMMKGTESDTAPLTLGITLSIMWSADYLINRHIGQWGGNAANLPITFLGFYLAGYGFRRVESRLKNPRVLLMFGILLLIGIVSAILVKGIEASQTTNGIPFFYANSYFGIPLMMVSISVFPLLLQSQTVAHLGEKKWIRIISDASFGVYLVHIMFMDVAFRIMGINMPHGLPLIILWALLVFALSFVFTLTLQLIPFANLVVGGPNKALNR